MNKSDFLVDGPKNSNNTFVFAHGAGAPMDSEWMNTVTGHLAKAGIRVVRFEFPYMNERRLSGKKRPPNTATVLTETWKEVIGLVANSGNLFIGGKSMGGRIASLVADEVTTDGLICLGFPFHAPGKPLGPRLTSLQQVQTPSLIIQGTRDAMGNHDELQSVQFNPKLEFFWLEDGDHSFKPRKKSGFTLEQHIESGCQRILDFIS